MESLVNLTKVARKIQHVRHLCNPGNHLTRSNEAGTHFPPLLEAYHTLPGGGLQKHHIVDLKLQVFSSSVGIALLPTLSILQYLSDLLDKLHGLKDYFGPSHNSMTNLSPTNQGTTPSTIQELKWWSTNDVVITVVVG